MLELQQIESSLGLEDITAILASSTFPLHSDPANRFTRKDAIRVLELNFRQSFFFLCKVSFTAPINEE